MGMNNRGLVGGCNIARTEEMYAKKLDLTQIRAVDRAYLLRAHGDPAYVSGYVAHNYHYLWASLMLTGRSADALAAAGALARFANVLGTLAAGRGLRAVLLGSAAEAATEGTAP